MSPLIVYYSTKSENTKRFVESLGMESVRIPIKWDDTAPFLVNRPFVLITPSYGGGELKGSVPISVIKFLNIVKNRENIEAVISTGNRTFGKAFCMAGKIIASKCNVPNLMDVEIFGTPSDSETAIQLISRITKQQ